MTATEAFGVRDGEVTTDLPAAVDAGVYYIGRIRTPWTDRKQCPKNARGSEVACTIELDPRFTDALKDVETCTHLVLLYWMDKAPRNLVRQVPGHGASGGAQHGTFALRSPARPNPIAMSVVKLLGIDGNKLSVVGLDCLDGTPLLDIKPYLPTVDSVPEAVCGWRQRKG
ncbi:MAG: tRNA (N6-threonylcarbamoyladenosine(37)-N6)-methyltransferase TrmO [Pseudolabrys sp.]